MYWTEVRPCWTECTVATTEGPDVSRNITLEADYTRHTQRYIRNTSGPDVCWNRNITHTGDYSTRTTLHMQHILNRHTFQTDKRVKTETAQGRTEQKTGTRDGEQRNRCPCPCPCTVLCTVYCALSVYVYCTLYCVCVVQLPGCSTSQSKRQLSEWIDSRDQRSSCISVSATWCRESSGDTVVL
jgi:hypothetical protein